MASLLPESTGYFILVGIGLLFAFVVTFSSKPKQDGWVLKKLLIGSSQQEGT
jgi:hypothetical protein